MIELNFINSLIILGLGLLAAWFVTCSILVIAAIVKIIKGKRNGHTDNRTENNLRVLSNREEGEPSEKDNE